MTKDQLEQMVRSMMGYTQSKPDAQEDADYQQYLTKEELSRNGHIDFQEIIHQVVNPK